MPGKKHCRAEYDMYRRDYEISYGSEEPKGKSGHGETDEMIMEANISLTQLKIAEMLEDSDEKQRREGETVEMILEANISLLQSQIVDFLEDSDKNQRRQDEYDEKEEVREKAEHDQRLQEDEKELCRWKKRILVENQYALEVNSSQQAMASSTKKCHELALQYAEAKKQMDSDFKIYAQNVRKQSEFLRKEARSRVVHLVCRGCSGC